MPASFLFLTDSVHAHRRVYVSTAQGGDHLQARQTSKGQTKARWTTIWDFYHPELWKNQYLLFKLPGL